MACMYTAKSGSHTSNASIVRTNSRLTSMGFVPVGSAIDTQIKFSFMLESYMIDQSHHIFDFRRRELK